MFGIPLPWIIIGVSIALFGSYRGGYHFGWSDRDAEMQIEIAKKNDEARELEKNMASKLADKETQLRKAQNDVAQKQSAMHKLAATGELRLPSRCVQASTNTPAPAGDKQDGTDIERQTIEALIDIVAEGDKAITKLNACVDSYNQVRDLVNGNR